MLKELFDLEKAKKVVKDAEEAAIKAAEEAKKRARENSIMEYEALFERLCKDKEIKISRALVEGRELIFIISLSRDDHEAEHAWQFAAGLRNAEIEVRLDKVFAKSEVHIHLHRRFLTTDLDPLFFSESDLSYLD